MIKAVLDTNILVSGIVGFTIPDNTSGEILRLWYKKHFHLVISEPLIQEVLRTLRKPYFEKHVNPNRASRLAALLRYQSILTSINEMVEGIATHQEDDMVLATALSGGARFVVTGDEKLQKLITFKEINILGPQQFHNKIVSLKE
jgi:uncharacterized protein